MLIKIGYYKTLIILARKAYMLIQSILKERRELVHSHDINNVVTIGVLIVMLTVL